MITFTCPRCFQPVNAADDIGGKTCLCPHCNHEMVLPSYAIPSTIQASKPAPELGKPPEFVGLTASTYVPPSRKKEGGGWAGTFGTGNLKHGVIAVFLTIGFYALLFVQIAAVGGTNGFANKFTDRGWTCYASMFLSFWAFSILAEKFVRVRRRRGCLAATFIPDNAPLTTNAEIEHAMTVARETSKRVKDTIIGHRIRRALEHFRASRDLKEVGDILREESDSDFAQLDSSYALIRVFLWTIPILGFIGTVIGVGDAVGGFSGFLSAAQDVSQIKTALTGVTAGLSVAFDTTFVALIMSVGVMMATSTVEKAEKDQLQGIEDYCQNRVLRRLSARVVFQENEPASEPIRIIGRNAVPDVETWRNETLKIAQSLAGALIKAWKTTGQEWFAGVEALQKEAAENFRKHLAAQEQMAGEWMKIQSAVADLLPQMKARFESELTELRKVAESAQSGLHETIRYQIEVIGQQIQGIQTASEKLAEIIPLQMRMEDRLLRAAGSDGLAALLADVRNALQSLDPALHRIADKPLDVEVRFSAGPPAAGR